MGGDGTMSRISEEQVTLHDLFEASDEDGDSKGWLLCKAECIAQDANVSLRTVITRAVNRFFEDHHREFIDNPEDFRIPTMEESESVGRILRSIDPS